MICTSIVEKNIDKCLEILRTCEMAELRFDKINIQSVADIQPLCSVDIPIIATCRTGSYSTKQRFEILLEAIKNGAAYVDIEIDSLAEYSNQIITAAGNCNCKVIISYHNFQETPDINVLQQIVVQAEKYNPCLIKIVTTAKKFVDNFTVISLAKQNSKVIAFAMGVAGIFSRIKSYSDGAPFMYAAHTHNTASAEGQLTVAEIKKVFEL